MSARDTYPCLVDMTIVGYLACDQCGVDDRTPLVDVGHEVDYANGDAKLCAACLRAALALLEPRCGTVALGLGGLSCTRPAEHVGPCAHVVRP